MLLNKPSVPQTINLINSVAMSSVGRNNINYSLLFMKYKSLTENRGSGFLSARKMSSYCKYHVKPFSNLHIHILHVLRALKAVCVMLSLVIDLQESHCLVKQCSPLGWLPQGRNWQQDLGLVGFVEKASHLIGSQMLLERPLTLYGAESC